MHSEIGEINAEFGRWVREQRKSRGWTLVEAAGKIGITHAHLSNIERGTRTCSIRLQRDIERAFMSPVSGDSIDLLASHLTEEELELIKLWRALPRSIRSYHLKAFRFAIDSED